MNTTSPMTKATWNKPLAWRSFDIRAEVRLESNYLGEVVNTLKL